MKGLSGKVALVTGAASGIGLASAERFVQEGANVMLADIDTDAGAQAADRLNGEGARTHFIRTDVTDESAVQQMVERTIDEFGRLDIAHNNVGWAGNDPKLLGEVSEREWQNEADLSLTSTWRCIKHELPHLADVSGCIINTASIAGIDGRTNIAPYAAMKHGVIGLTKSAALEYADLGIRVNAVTPGPVDTPALRQLGEEELARQRDSVPLGRLADPADVAGGVAWLASEDASFVTGHSLVIDGGKTAGPA